MLDTRCVGARNNRELEHLSQSRRVAILFTLVILGPFSVLLVASTVRDGGVGGFSTMNSYWQWRHIGIAIGDSGTVHCGS